METYNYDAEVDARGDTCPLPVVKAKKAISVSNNHSDDSGNWLFCLCVCVKIPSLAVVR